VARTFLFVAALLMASVVSAQPIPVLQFEASPALRPVQTRLESWNLNSFRSIVALVGLSDAGEPIRVVLADHDSAWARRVPTWVGGYAVSMQHLIVLFPSRAPTWPHDTLEDVLRHEVTHILIDRAAGGRRVPRWFHEGLAEAAERPPGMGDSARLASAMLSGPRLTLTEIDALFDGTPQSSARGYVLAAAVVRDLIGTYGPSFPATVLREVASGHSFDAAITTQTGRSLPSVAADFWNRQRRWTLWIPVLASSTVVWLGIIALGAMARRRRRQRTAALRRQWDTEEEEK
jgi:hypothetical protein